MLDFLVQTFKEQKGIICSSCCAHNKNIFDYPLVFYYLRSSCLEKRQNRCENRGLLDARLRSPLYLHEQRYQYLNFNKYFKINGTGPSAGFRVGNPKISKPQN